jgi:hypothetical protein
MRPVRGLKTPELPRQRSAACDRRDAVAVECEEGRSGPRRQVQARWLAPFRRVQRPARECFRPDTGRSGIRRYARNAARGFRHLLGSSRSFIAWRATTTAASASLQERHTANSIDYYADSGLEFIGLSDQRPKDKFGIAAAYAHVSPWARALDTDFRNLSSSGWPIRSFEGLFTAVYQYEIRAGWTLQPNYQHIVHPGGGATNPSANNPGKRLKNAEVFGLRTVVKF